MQGLGLTRFGKALGGVPPDRLQQPEAPGSRISHDQRAVHEAAGELEDVLSGQTDTRAGRLCGLGRPAAAEHGQPSEQRLLGLRQQFMAPVDRGSQRALPGVRGSAA